MIKAVTKGGSGTQSWVESRGDREQSTSNRGEECGQGCRTQDWKAVEKNRGGPGPRMGFVKRKQKRPRRDDVTPRDRARVIRQRWRRPLPNWPPHLLTHSPVLRPLVARLTPSRFQVLSPASCVYPHVVIRAAAPTIVFGGASLNPVERLGD
jgi:hypothetical protein